MPRHQVAQCVGNRQPRNKRHDRADNDFVQFPADACMDKDVSCNPDHKRSDKFSKETHLYESVDGMRAEKAKAACNTRRQKINPAA